MIQELENNEVFSNDYRNVAPREGDLAAVFERDGRRLMMALDGEGAMSLPDASLFSEYWLDPHDEEADRKALKAGGRLVYLFSVGKTNYYSFLYMGQNRPDFSFTGMSFMPFSFESRPTPKNVYFGAETAFQLSSWYNGNRFCGRCGGQMSVHPRMRCLRCNSCGNMDFPRVMPAVTIAVIHDEKLLLIRYKKREEDEYAGISLIAGFVEVGETIEDAVRREVMEESGLRAANIRYYKSQPWGFASNLMIGIVCDIEGSDEIDVQDTNEVAEAVWLTRDEIHAQDNGVSLTFEMIDRFKNGDDLLQINLL